MGRNAFLIVFFFAMMALLLTFTSHGLFILERISLIDQVKGQVEVERAGSGKVVKARMGLPVKTGDTVVTGPNSWVRLHWADGTKMLIGPNSKVKVRKSHFNLSSKKEESLFSLTVGVAFSSLHKKLSKNSFFEVETPIAVAGVRGTQFMVLFEGGRCSVSVLRGVVEVKSDKVKASLLPGEGADIFSKGEIRKRLMRGEEKEAWEEKLPTLLAPHLRILKPLDGSIVSVSEVTISGVTDSFATVSVNGRTVRLDQQGKFKATLRLKEGTNKVKVVAEDRAGHKTVKVLTLQFKPSESERGGLRGPSPR